MMTVVKKTVSLDDNMFALISDNNDQLAPADGKVELGQDNSKFRSLLNNNKWIVHMKD